MSNDTVWMTTRGGASRKYHTDETCTHVTANHNPRSKASIAGFFDPCPDCTQEDGDA